MKKVAIYARVSTKDQSPEMQLRELREYAERRGFVVFDEYVDIGVSGTKERRPELDRLMKDARQRKFDAVLVWKFDRFARSTKHLLIALEEFRANGIDFISYTEAFDTSSPIGEAMFTVIGAMAKLERDLISERVRAGMRKAKADGKKVGRPPIEVDIEKVLGLVGEGKSLRQIARELAISKSKVWSVLQEHSVQKASINYGK